MAEQDDHNKELLAEYFWLFTFKEPDSSTEKKVLPPQRRLLPVTEDDICPKLKGFSGFGKFHFTSKDRDIKDELFITCNWNAVDIFAVDQKWECIRTIKLAEVGDRIHDANELIDGLSGRYFCWRSGSDILSVCDLETGKLVHSIHSGGTGHLSSDGSMMLCHQFSDTIKTLWTESGTMIGSTDISGSYCYPDPFFIKNNSRVLIPWINPDDLYGRGRLGMIVDATTHSVVERVSYSVGFYEQQTQSTGSQGQYIYSLHGSKLDLIRLQDIVVPPYPQQRQHCGNRCLGELSAVKRPPIAREARGAETTERVSESDLNITVEYRRVTYDEYAIVVSISNDQGESREILQIPPLDFSDVYSDYRFYLDKTNLQLITDCKLVVLVWKLPTTFEGSISLQSAFWMPSFACLDKSVDQIQKLLAPRFSTELKTCHHGHYYVSPQVGLKGSKALPVYSDDLFSLELPRAFSTLFALIQMFEAADNTFQNAILQYVGPYVNRTLEYNHNPETILTVICRNVRRDNHKMINAFLKAIFDQPNVRWVPNPGSGCENPISLLLNVAKTDPQDVKLAQIAISLALTVYKYCIRMAKEEKDRHFLWPVMDSLSRLQVLHQHTDLVLNLLRGLVYFPVEDRSYIVDHGIIASPPSFSWPFRGRKEKSIYDYDNPVLHLDLSPTYKEPNPLHENLSWDLFVASFDMLWRAPEKESEMDTRSPVERIRGHGAPPPPSWIRTLFSIILYKFKSPPHKRVECYKIPLEALDNPAIAALIEYKWNTIGHNYWLARFSWQCLYYILVLVTVFTQVYDGSEGSSLMGVFIAIITMASIFLLLELRQFFHDPGRYIKSPYNLVDLVAFGLPLAASACQIVNITKNENGNTSTLSFSVLFIFLHILFELRVNMNVCHYVAIIISIISKIRIFFLIFASGILAFAIAILHLLRGCPVGGCEMDVQFPSSFPRAVSATYFLLGGMWDPVNENFSNKNKDEWAFNIMMVLYFFFTTILLLNVLIALMNSAYEDGDVTWELVWKESRLRCIEGAETLTYNIPGFRQAHDIFPEKIYYFATHQEQKDYIAKYSKKNKNVLIDTQSHDISDTVDMSIGKNDDSQGSSSAATTAAGAASSSSSPSKTAVLKTIQKGQEALKKQHETNQQELKREMQSQGQVVTHLKDQLQELEKQMADMKEMLAAALAAARP
ncbi:hypothetical protein BGX34_010702 [Mortierella sp. NVP85]|nr:hypothetical protein BGX34_010702 [Mortierella sp. NVP85]